MSLSVVPRTSASALASRSQQGAAGAYQASGVAKSGEGTAGAVDIVDMVRFYSYDRTAPLSARLTLKEENPWYRRYELTYVSEGDTVYAAYFEPRTAAGGSGRLPAVIGVHGMFSEAEDQFWFVADFAAKRGFAVLMPSLPYHHRRAKGIQFTSGQKFVVALPETVRDNFRRAVIDMRRGLDWLAARDEVDPRRIYITGASLGGIVSMLAYKADPRFSGAVFLVSGGGFAGILAHSDTPVVRNFRLVTKLGVADVSEVAKTLTIVDPAALPDLWPRPVLMLNAAEDVIFPVDEVKRAAGTFHSPKIVWAKSSHYFPVAGAQYLMADFWASLAGTVLAVRTPEGSTCRETVLPLVPGDSRLWVDLFLDDQVKAGAGAGPRAGAGVEHLADVGSVGFSFHRDGGAMPGGDGRGRSARFGIHLVNRMTPTLVVPGTLWNAEECRSVLEEVPASVFITGGDTVRDLAFALSYIRVLGRGEAGVYVLRVNHDSGSASACACTSASTAPPALGCARASTSTLLAGATGPVRSPSPSPNSSSSSGSSYSSTSGAGVNSNFASGSSSGPGAGGGAGSEEGSGTVGVAFLGPLDVEVAWSRCSSAVASGLAEAGIAGIPGLAFDEVPCGSLKAYLGERVTVSRLAPIPALPDDTLLDIRWAEPPF